MAYQAKRTNYKGMWFKSNLEAKTAEAFDRLGIRWEYESRCFRDRRYSGGQYTPDFWLPDAYTYVEVVGRIDDRHYNNAITFITNMRVHSPYETREIIQNGRYLMPWDMPKIEAPSDDTPCFAFVIGSGMIKVLDESTLSDGSVFRCRKCGKVSFIDSRNKWSCIHCGHYDESYGCNFSLFELAGMYA